MNSHDMAILVIVLAGTLLLCLAAVYCVYLRRRSASPESNQLAYEEL